jgi:RNA-directed DNA polymerase
VQKSVNNFDPLNQWYKPRGYPHFDFRVSKDYAKSKVEAPENIINHSFWPFLRKIQCTPKYKRDLKKVSSKDRPIMYASHIDSHIYSWYTHLLNKRYEERIKETDLNFSVLAYRALGKSNIDFAKDVFDEVEKREHCIVLTFDISKFFDCIDHKNLKLSWCRLLDLDNSKLPKDHYKVYKSITKYSYINMSDVCQELKIKDFRELQSRRRICSPQEFRSKLKSSVKININEQGIPQGSPISALLSNIFLWEFDIKMSNHALETGGIYRRYCDDILWICHPEKSDETMHKVHQEIQNSGSNLTINKEKSEKSEFIRENGLLYYHPETQPLQYLGFIFDGQKRVIRSQTVSRYYRRMKRAIYFTKKAAKESDRGEIIYRRSLYERFTHLGKRNFIKYAYRASKIMNSAEIKGQTSRHWKKINAAIQQDN